MKDGVLLVGSGIMAEEYSKVLISLGVAFIVIGRGAKSAKAFTRKTGISVIEGGLDNYLNTKPVLPSNAIICVGIEQLANTSQKLIAYGVKNILLEKPGALTKEELYRTISLAREGSARVLIAYNRRFYITTKKCIELIDEDGGIKSFRFEFTEWSHEIEKLSQATCIKNIWFLANSTHVVDLAFFLGGRPRCINTYSSGALDWHPASSIFSGAGITNSDALFSYHANWEAPGRWGLEILTTKRRLILSPMESLKIMYRGSTEIENHVLNNKIDIEFKPGLYSMVEQFLNKNDERMCTIEEQVSNWEIYTQIAGYND